MMRTRNYLCYALLIVMGYISSCTNNNSTATTNLTVDNKEAEGINIPNNELNGYKLYRSNRFSINYPNTWTVIENPNQYVTVSIVAPERGDKFKTNLNVIVSNRGNVSLEDLFQAQQTQMKSALSGYRLDNKEHITINGVSGIKSTASYGINGYSVKGIQYILKRADNTLYTITFTVGVESYNSDKDLIWKIIQTFKTF